MPIPQPSHEYDSFTIAHVPSNPEPYRLLNRMPIVDKGEPLVDLRETNRELSFSDYCLPYVRESVAEALNAATRSLPEHLDLRVHTALRTLDQQAEMYWHNYNKTKEQHPEWPESVVRRMTNRFFAPPDAKAPPGHCTGAAVDVGLFDRTTGKGLEMWAPLEGWKGAPTAARGLGPEAAENRRLLCYLMHSTGLSNCRDEFWHWSYGDSAWAVRVGASEACYGLVEPPEGHSRVTGERLEMHPYNPDWPVQFEAIRAVLLETLGSLAIRIEHVGSTSIPGIHAKPILDIDIVVGHSEAMLVVIEKLGEFGYEHQGDLGVQGREAFKPKLGDEGKDTPAKSWPKHHLYACLQENLELRRHLAFRDYLRTNQAAAAEYAALKLRLAERHPWDRTKYTDLKGPFVDEILRAMGLGLA